LNLPIHIVYKTDTFLQVCRGKGIGRTSQHFTKVNQWVCPFTLWVLLRQCTVIIGSLYTLSDKLKAQVEQVRVSREVQGEIVELQVLQTWSLGTTARPMRTCKIFWNGWGSNNTDIYRTLYSFSGTFHNKKDAQSWYIIVWQSHT